MQGATQNVGEAVCSRETFQTTEQRPQVREIVRHVREHRPFEKEFVNEVSFSIITCQPRLTSMQVPPPLLLYIMLLVCGGFCKRAGSQVVSTCLLLTVVAIQHVNSLTVSCIACRNTCTIHAHVHACIHESNLHL